MPNSPIADAARARAIAGRGVFARGSAAPAPLSLLPLLDVLTATIGVFITIIAFQVYATTASGGASRVDVLIVAEPGDTFLLFERGTDQPKPLYLSRLRDELLRIGRPLERPVRILAAFGPHALDERKSLQYYLDRLSRRDPKPAPTARGEHPAAIPDAVGFSLTWVPLDSTGEARGALLRRWAEDAGRHGEEATDAER